MSQIIDAKGRVFSSHEERAAFHAAKKGQWAAEFKKNCDEQKARWAEEAQAFYAAMRRDETMLVLVSPKIEDGGFIPNWRFAKTMKVSEAITLAEPHGLAINLDWNGSNFAFTVDQARAVIAQ